MKKLAALTLSVLMFTPMVRAADSASEGEKPPKSFLGEDDAARAARRAWWVHDRFGMFIHFGYYSMRGRHEWVKSREGILDAEYDKYLKYYNPDLFNAKEWAAICKKAGMKYCVLTTKHHEGFCMWDASNTDYKITNTPFGRDLVREYVDAFRAEGIKIGFYYSLMDWHHPDYTVDNPHPFVRRYKVWDKSPEEADRMFAEWNKNRDMARYRKYMFEQVEELLTKYGKIDIIWYDYTPKHPKAGKSWKDWDAVELVKLTHRLQPGILIDNRLDLMDSDDGWDFVTPEQFKVQSRPLANGKVVPWETCQTFSGSWGYYRDEHTWKSAEQCIELLTETVSKDGNLIMNVGPTGRGEFDYRAKDRLEAYAKWMRVNSRSIYGCGEAPAGFETPNGTSLTYNKQTNVLYVHLDDYPMGFLPVNFWDKIAYAQFLHDGSELKVVSPKRGHSQDGAPEKNYGGFELPVQKPAGMIAPVIEVFLKK